MINQGDIYWIDLEEPEGAEPGYKHPHIIVQNNLFNHSQIKTVLVCPLTSNLKRASSPGNVLLEKKESKLPKQSVVNVSQVFTVDKDRLEDYVGTVSSGRIADIINGIKLVLDPRESE